MKWCRQAMFIKLLLNRSFQHFMTEGLSIRIFGTYCEGKGGGPEWKVTPKWSEDLSSSYLLLWNPVTSLCTCASWVSPVNGDSARELHMHIYAYIYVYIESKQLQLQPRELPAEFCVRNHFIWSSFLKFFIPRRSFSSPAHFSCVKITVKHCSFISFHSAILQLRICSDSADTFYV